MELVGAQSFRTFTVRRVSQWISWDKFFSSQRPQEAVSSEHAGAWISWDLKLDTWRGDIWKFVCLIGAWYVVQCPLYLVAPLTIIRHNIVRGDSWLGAAVEKMEQRSR